MFCLCRHRLEGLGIPRAGLAAFAVDSLSFALKIWSSDSKRHRPVPGKFPPYQNNQKVDRVREIEEAETLKPPSFGELPADWVVKFKQDQGQPPTTQAQVDSIFAVHFVNPQNYE
jgi:hypothetical protein